LRARRDRCGDIAGELLLEIDDGGGRRPRVEDALDRVEADEAFVVEEVGVTAARQRRLVARVDRRVEIRKERLERPFEVLVHRSRHRPRRLHRSDRVRIRLLVPTRRSRRRRSVRDRLHGGAHQLQLPADRLAHSGRDVAAVLRVALRGRRRRTRGGPDRESDDEEAWERAAHRQNMARVMEFATPRSDVTQEVTVTRTVTLA